MSGIRRVAAACAVAGLALCTSLATAAPSFGWGFKVTTVAKGLDNPRELAFGPDGKLYVAEAGHGGEECATHGTETSCVGFTSGVSRIESGTPHKVLNGFFSISEGGGFGATGVDGISFFDNRLFGIEAGSQDAVPPAGFAPATLAKAREQAGRLGVANSSGHVSEVANVGHFDFQWAKEHKSLVPEQFPDANPYAVLAGSFGELVTDAGSNTLDFVSPGGAVQVVQFFPSPKTTPPESDAVPTCLAKGPDGAIYIGELTGAASAPGESVVWRWTPGHLTKWASGLTAVTGCGFAGDGQFYAVEFSTNGLVAAAPGTGAVVRVPPGSTSPTTVVSGLSFPGGFVAAGNSAWVSNWTVAPADSHGGPTGEVVRITKG